MQNCKLECFFYQSDERDTLIFLQQAIDQFGERYTVLPDFIIINFWRRFRELSSDYWISLPHGPLSIRLYSPQDSDLPIEEIEYISLRSDVALCFKKI